MISEIQNLKEPQDPTHLLQAACVCDVLADRQCTVHGHVHLAHMVATVLVDQAVAHLSELLVRLVAPPVLEVAVLVELPTAIVESVNDLVADYVAERTVVQVSRTALYGRGGFVLVFD